MPDWEGNYIYQIDIDYSNMLVMKDFDKLKSFTETYKYDPAPLNTIKNNFYPIGVTDIKWNTVSEQYDGIEINPLVHDARKKIAWYNSWDVASGCIWKASVIKNIKLLFKKEDDEWISANNN